MTRLYYNQQKIYLTCQIVDFKIPADQRVKLKECEKRDMYLDLAREWKKKLWNIKVTIISIVIGALGTVTKGLVQGLEDLEITAALLRSAKILSRVLETCCYSNLTEKATADVKNFQGEKKNTLSRTAHLL